MKEFTHYIFSVGACVYALSLLTPLSWPSILMALWLSISVNYVIDILGHSFGCGIPSRTRVTHSVFTAPLWGALVSVVSLDVLLRVTPPFILQSESLLWVSAGVSVAMGHLLLDSHSGGGLPLEGQGSNAHFRYDNLALNVVFVATGLLLIVMATNLTQIPPIHLSLIAETTINN